MYLGASGYCLHHLGQAVSVSFPPPSALIIFPVPRGKSSRGTRLSSGERRTALSLGSPGSQSWGPRVPAPLEPCGPNNLQIPAQHCGARGSGPWVSDAPGSRARASLSVMADIQCGSPVSLFPVLDSSPSLSPSVFCFVFSYHKG